MWLEIVVAKLATNFQDLVAKVKNLVALAPVLGAILRPEYVGGFFNKTIIPLALVGYEMIIANSALRATLAIYHLISNVRSWNNC